MANASERPTDDIEMTVDKYGDMLFRMCVFMLKNESDAEDAVQETMIKRYERAPIFADCEHEKAWLIRVAANRCRDILRYRARHPQISDECLAKFSQEASDSGMMEALACVPEKFRLVSVNTETLTVLAAFADPEMIPYRYAEKMGIAAYQIVDADGSVVKEGASATAEIVNGQATIGIRLDDMDSGSYRLIVTAFVLEKKADQPLQVSGSWEYSFHR